VALTKVVVLCTGILNLCMLYPKYLFICFICFIDLLDTVTTR